TPYHAGDVFAVIGGIQHFDAAGNDLDCIGCIYGLNAGIAFRPNGNLLAADFSLGGGTTGVIKEFDTNGNEIGNFATDNDGYLPKSLAIDLAGNVYVGEDAPFGVADGRLLKYNALGELQEPMFFPDVENDGVSRIALAADQCTIYYTSGGVEIKRYDVCAQSQRSDFVSTGASSKGALQIRGNGDVLVVSNSGHEIDRYDSSGTLRQVYSYPTDLTSLAEPMDASTNEAVVNDASGIHFNAFGGDDILIDGEQMTVTGKSGNSVTVLRDT